MPWTKLSDDFGDECWTLSDAAFRLHVEGLLWSNRKLLDLEIPLADLPRFAKNPEALAELFAVGWWQEGGDVARIIHQGDYQRPREAVLSQQRANAENGRKGGRPPKPGRVPPPTPPSPSAKPKTRSLSDSKSERDRTGIYGNQPSTEANETQSPSESKSERVSGDMLDYCRVCGAGLAWAVARRFAFCDRDDVKHRAARDAA